MSEKTREQALAELRVLLASHGIAPHGKRALDLTDAETEQWLQEFLQVMGRLGRQLHEAMTQAVVTITQAFRPITSDPQLMAALEGAAAERERARR